MTDPRRQQRNSSGTSLHVATAPDGHTLQLQLLGDFLITLGDQELHDAEWRLRKAGHLLKLLALAPSHRLQREQVIDVLWPNLSPDAAANNLYYALHVARRALDPDPNARDRYLRSRRGELALDPDCPIWIDAEAFESLATQARESADPRVYREALDLYRGDLLPQDVYEEWTIEPRETLRQLYLTLLLELAQLHETRGEVDLAIESYQQLVARTPADEAGHTGLMRLYAATGLRHQALKQFDVLRSVLDEDLDVTPARETVALYQHILSGKSIDLEQCGHARQLETSASPRSPPTNLPTPLTSFVGRQAEIAELQTLLRRRRLVTLTGAGGIGKTRLAIASVRNELHQFPDGVFLVSLAPVRQAEFVLPAIAQILGAREAAERSLLQSVTETIDDKRLLLILDNVEHLAEASPILTRLLETCPHLHMLLTSRIRLRLHGEQEYPVEPLALPDSSVLDVAEAGHAAAVELFVQRAQEVQPGFRLTDENVRPVAEILRRLDGLPLAIELAAARVKVLPPPAILARLDHPLTLLTGGPRDLPARQQTIRDTIAWSHDLLATNEKRLFRRLSIFIGGWTLEAAEAVVQDDHSVSDDVLDRLSALVDHSLVRRQDVGSYPRYGMLEIIREFGLDQLASAAEVEVMRERHATHFCELAEQAESGFLGTDEVAWLDRIEQELGNIRAALEWSSADPSRASTGLGLATALWNFWDMHGRPSEGRRWIQALLPHVPGRTMLHARALYASGYLATRQGDPSGAKRPLEAALGLFHDFGDKPGESQTLAILGTLASFEGDFERSTALLERALAVFRETKDQLGVARILLDLGDQVRAEGDYARARKLLSESLTLFRSLEISHGAGWALTNLGNTARAVGDLELARVHQEESRAIFAELGDKRGLARPVLYLANLARLENDDDTARKLFLESLDLLRELQDQWRLPVWLYYVGLTASQRGAHERATRLFAAAAASHERFDTLLDPAEREDWDQALQVARETLGKDAFRSASESGKALDFDGAIELALEVLNS